jgi:hypothetical protein
MPTKPKVTFAPDTRNPQNPSPAISDAYVFVPKKDILEIERQLDEFNEQNKFTTDEGYCEQARAVLNIGQARRSSVSIVRSHRDSQVRERPDEVTRTPKTANSAMAGSHEKARGRQRREKNRRTHTSSMHTIMTEVDGREEGQSERIKVESLVRSATVTKSKEPVNLQPGKVKFASASLDHSNVSDHDHDLAVEEWARKNEQNWKEEEISSDKQPIHVTSGRVAASPKVKVASKSTKPKAYKETMTEYKKELLREGNYLGEDPDEISYRHPKPALKTKAQQEEYYEQLMEDKKRRKCPADELSRSSRTLSPLSFTKDSANDLMKGAENGSTDQSIKSDDKADHLIAGGPQELVSQQITTESSLGVEVEKRDADSDDDTQSDQTQPTLTPTTPTKSLFARDPSGNAGKQYIKFDITSPSVPLQSLSPFLSEPIPGKRKTRGLKPAAGLFGDYHPPNRESSSRESSIEETIISEGAQTTLRKTSGNFFHKPIQNSSDSPVCSIEEEEHSPSETEEEEPGEEEELDHEPEAQEPERLIGFPPVDSLPGWFPDSIKQIYGVDRGGGQLSYNVSVHPTPIPISSDQGPPNSLKPHAH